MTPEEYERILNICRSVESLADEDREAAIERACGGDDSLAHEVRVWLQTESECDNTFEQPLLENLDLEQAWDDANAFIDETSLEQQKYPEKIGPFRILGILGRGGMSVVYRAEQDRPKREIALKLPLYGLSGTRSYRRFLVEAEALGRLHHPGIAQVYEAGLAEVDGRRMIYIAMELVNGITLGELLREKKPSLDDCISLLIQICEAVNHAHQRGIIHRDLKPSNIMIEEGEEGFRPRILDFGVAKITTSEHAGWRTMTTIGQTMGTLAYMSPEQVTGNETSVDTRSDVYSIGVMAYEMLTGWQPFSGEESSLFHTMRSILRHELRPPEEMNPELAGDLSTIVMKATAKDVQARYRSAAAFRDDLKRFVNDEPILARSPSLWYTSKKFVRRHRLPALLGLLLVMMFIVGSVVTTWAMLRYRGTADQLAEQQAELSETATFLTHDLVRNISALKGTVAIRERLLKRLLQMVETVRESQPYDANLDQNEAFILIYLSDVEYNTHRLEAALQHRREALAIRQSVLEHDPNDGHLLALVSTNLVKIGDIFRQQGKREEMKSLYMQALEIDESLVAAHRKKVHYLDNLSWSYERVGNMEMEEGQYVKADEYFRRRLRLSQQLVRENPENLTALDGLCSAYNQLSELAFRSGELPEAEAYALEAFRIAGDLLSRAPDNVIYIVAYGRGADRCATIAVERSDLAGAQQYYLLGWGKIAALLGSEHQHPDVTNVARQLLKVRMRIARLNHDVDGGINAAREALQLEIGSRGEHPADHHGLSVLAVLNLRMAELFINDMKNDADGYPYLDAAYRFEKEIFAGDHITSDDYYQYAQMIVSDPRSLEKEFKLGIQHIDTAIAHSLGDRPEYWFTRSLLHQKLGELQVAHDDMQKAIDGARGQRRDEYLNQLKLFEQRLDVQDESDGN